MGCRENFRDCTSDPSMIDSRPLSCFFLAVSWHSERERKSVLSSMNIDLEDSDETLQRTHASVIGDQAFQQALKGKGGFRTLTAKPI